MTNIQEQNRKKGGRPPTGRVRKLSKSVTVKFSKPSYEALRLRARKANRKLAVKVLVFRTDTGIVISWFV